MWRQTFCVATASVALLLGCAPSNDAAGGTGTTMSKSCGGDPDRPTTCTYWTCTNVPSQYGNKTHCTSSQPPGSPHPGGDYTCPEAGGGLFCPGNDAGGSGPWSCHADDVGLACDSGGGLPGGHTICYYPSGGNSTSGPPSATVEYAFETLAGADVIHVRLTFDRGFVDNTYGTTAVGWPRGHKFLDLVGSDHAELQLTNAGGGTALDFKLDYISADSSAPSGYRNLGVRGGDGGMLIGDAASIAATMTSLDRNLNERGHAGYTVNSPATDASYTPDPAAPDWDFAVVYEVWVQKAAFGSAGFGDVELSYVHASPSKTGSNTITVGPGTCPPNWGPP